MEKHYFFDFAEAANGSYYIRISRSDHQPDDTYERTGVVIFQEDFEFAMEGLSSLFRTVGHQLRHEGKSESLNGIKSWNPESRPREKMMAAGREAMSDAELLAMLIGSGTPNESAVALAERILASIDNEPGLLAFMPMDQLCRFKGMGLAKSSTVIAAMELGLRVATHYHKKLLFKAMNN
ncbi:MAG TPA: UPF0758 domain-containing protein [Mucilaginibacter sp.]|nr:UPF0758 domain-containing protein [Mucilaginibacter sp.]